MTQMQPIHPLKPVRRPSPLSGVVLGFLLVLFLAAFVYAGYLFVQTTRYIVASAPQMADPISNVGGAIASEAETAGATVLQSVNAPQSQNATVSLLAPLLNEKEPINILLLGIDQRPGETGYYRTDTMILVTIDPATNDIGMLSLPRDLWVPIPGFYETRINSAHVLGDVNRYPGGGPALAKDTVAAFIGQPVQYYVRINFDGFRRILEQIGCIDVTVPKDIDDPLFPDMNYGYEPFVLKAGDYCMDADLALKYARTRHADSDFGRMQRQQQVLVAVKNKVLDTGDLPQLITRLPALVTALSDSLSTDIPISQQIALANFARKLDAANVRQLVIDNDMVERTIMDSGADVLMPKMDVIRAALADYFNPGQEQTTTDETPIAEQLASENARVAVLNGTSDATLARQVAEWLSGQGVNVVGYGEADRDDYAQSQLLLYTDKPATRQFLVERFGIANDNVRENAGANTDTDMRLIVGADFQLPGE